MYGCVIVRKTTLWTSDSMGRTSLPRWSTISYTGQHVVYSTTSFYGQNLDFLWNATVCSALPLLLLLAWSCFVFSPLQVWAP